MGANPVETSAHNSSGSARGRRGGQESPDSGQSSSINEKVPDAVVKQDERKFGREANLVLTVFALLVAMVLVTWYLWEDQYLSHNKDLIYNLGLIGGLMMLAQFGYAARKRSSKLRSSGPLKKWFAVHMVIGIVAPLIIIIHSRFDIDSINGGVALFAMLLVVFSGVVGRYLYSQTNFDLTEARRQLVKLHGAFQEFILTPNPALAREMEVELKKFMVQSFATPKNLGRSFVMAAGIGLRAKLLYFQLCQAAQNSVPNSQGIAAIETATVSAFSRPQKQLIKAYLDTLAKLARYNAYKRLFGLWRIGHVPVIYLLLVTGLAHVLAVHMY